jgi:hypothetical protein
MNGDILTLADAPSSGCRGRSGALAILHTAHTTPDHAIVQQSQGIAGNKAAEKWGPLSLIVRDVGDVREGDEERSLDPTALGIMVTTAARHALFLHRTDAAKRTGGGVCEAPSRLGKHRGRIRRRRRSRRAKGGGRGSQDDARPHRRAV